VKNSALEAPANLPSLDLDEFERAGSQAWWQRIAKETKGALDQATPRRLAADGTPLSPFYDALPGTFWPETPRRAQPGWKLTEDYTEAEDLTQIAQIIRSAHEGGADELLVRSDQLLNAEATRLVTQVGLPVIVELPPADSYLVPSLTQLGIVEPFVRLLSNARYPLLMAASWPFRSGVGLTLHIGWVAEAGGSAAEELGLLQALLVEFGISLRPPRFRLQVSVGLSVPIELAKLRAARSLVTHHLPDSQFQLHATTARFPLSLQEPQTNLIRTSTQAFTAVCGGADSLSIVPFDGVVGLPSELGVRTARGISHLMRHESHLHPVADPGAGSYALETIEHDLLSQAGRIAGEIHDAGGWSAAMASGLISRRIAQTAQLRAEAYANGQRKVVGVNAFKAADYQPISNTPGKFDPAASSLSPWRGPAAHE
jgi:hypothetical protein